MIAEGLVNMFTGFVKFVLGAFPTSGAPAWLENTSAQLQTVWTYGSGLGAWVPWSFVGTVLGAVLTCTVIGFGIKVARIVASFFTAGGGSAA